MPDLETETIKHRSQREKGIRPEPILTEIYRMNSSIFQSYVLPILHNHDSL